MSIMKKIILVMAVLLIINLSYAYEPKDLVWDGFVNIYLDKESFALDENITGTIVITNEEDYPIVGQQLVLQIGEGTYSYPSQFASDNTLSEDFISDIWVLPNTLSAQKFSLENPGSGKYHLDVYSWILKSKFPGSNAIYYEAKTKEFEVEGNNEYTEAEIVRVETNFGENKTIGPVGFPVVPNGTINGEVFIENKSTNQKSGLVLQVFLCDWASAFCEDTGKTFSVPTINPNNKIKIDVNLTAPETPSAYEINMILKGEKTESIYKNRVIVEGPTAKIRKVYIDGLANKKYSLNVLFAGSPDHFNYPTFKNFDIELEVYKENALIETVKDTITKIDTGEILSRDMNINSKDFDKACVRIVKNDFTYDEECFSVPLKELQEAYDKAFPEVVGIDWFYTEAEENLRIKFSKERMDNLDLRIRIFDGMDIIVEEEINGDSPITKNYSLKKKNYVMTVDDFFSRTQEVVRLELNKDDLDFTNNLNGNKSDLECNGIVCPEGKTCSGNTYESKQGVCCQATCIDSVVSSGEFSLFSMPFIFWLAIILLIIAIIIAVDTVKGEKK